MIFAFLSTPSARRATQAGGTAGRSEQDFYPRPPRGGRPRAQGSSDGDADFYPRPPRGGRHHQLFKAFAFHLFLSTPSARRATYGSTIVPIAFLFLSTPSARRATQHSADHIAQLDDFYPRPPRGGRPSCLCLFGVVDLISIHALREEGDVSSRLSSPTIKPFLSTPSARRATLQGAGWPLCNPYFYPRPPRGGRLWR